MLNKYHYTTGKRAYLSVHVPYMERSNVAIIIELKVSFYVRKYTKRIQKALMCTLYYHLSTICYQN